VRTQIGKWGNNLAVRIPGASLKDLDLEEGMDVDVSLGDGGMLHRRRPRQYSLAKLISRITPENMHGETDWGEAPERETW
jgi:antitoxin MazE